jgi:hypothetical protein
VQIKAALKQFLLQLKGAGKIDDADIDKNLDTWASKAYGQIQEKKETKSASKQAKDGIVKLSKTPKKATPETINANWVLKKVKLCMELDDEKARNALNELYQRKKEIDSFLSQGKNRQKTMSMLFTALYGLKKKEERLSKFAAYVVHLAGGGDIGMDKAEKYERLGQSKNPASMQQEATEAMRRYFLAAGGILKTTFGKPNTYYGAELKKAGYTSLATSDFNAANLLAACMMLRRTTIEVKTERNQEPFSSSNTRGTVEWIPQQAQPKAETPKNGEEKKEQKKEAPAAPAAEMSQTDKWIAAKFDDCKKAGTKEMPDAKAIARIDELYSGRDKINSHLQKNEKQSMVVFFNFINEHTSGALTTIAKELSGKYGALYKHITDNGKLLLDDGMIPLARTVLYRYVTKELQNNSLLKTEADNLKKMLGGLQLGENALRQNNPLTANALLHLALIIRRNALKAAGEDQYSVKVWDPTQVQSNLEPIKR